MDKKLGNALDLYKEAKKYLYNGNQNITKTVDEINKLIGVEKKEAFLKFDEREKENDDYCLNGNDDANNDYDENNNDDDL